ncbi:MAG: glycerate kinase [Burkholderiaceae bacterium]|jgi:hypothetical protein|nr:glycerate kinase [Burkholderiaceae bacterium]
MNIRSVLTLIGALALGALAWRVGGWQGIALLGSGLVLWALLYANQLLTVMKRAANRPVGYVGSAVMLNSKLKIGQTLLHVTALTRSLGQQLSDAGARPEVYRWSDPGDSHVTAEFEDGRLRRWRLERPADPPAS